MCLQQGSKTKMGLFPTQAILHKISTLQWDETFAIVLFSVIWKVWIVEMNSKISTEYKNFWSWCLLIEEHHSQLLYEHEDNFFLGSSYYWSSLSFFSFPVIYKLTLSPDSLSMAEIRCLSDHQDQIRALINVSGPSVKRLQPE